MKRSVFNRTIVSLLLVSLLSSFAMAAPLMLIGGGPYNIDADGVNGDGVVITGQLVALGCTVNFLPGAEIVADPSDSGPGDFVDYGSAVINISGGTIPGMLQVSESSVVTVAGSDFAVDGIALDPAQTVITSPAGFELTGTYSDGSACSLNVVLVTGAKLYLNVPEPTPSIMVYPASSPFNIGQVELGSVLTHPVQIFNEGNGALVVDSIAIDDSGDFAITSIDEKNSSTGDIIAADITLPYTLTDIQSYIEIEVTFTASQVGEASTTVTIASNDTEAGDVEKVLTATALEPAVPEISVFPETGVHDFGDIEVGLSQTVVVQILNEGNADLLINSITLESDGDYAITSEWYADPTISFPLVIAPSESVGVDIEITFTPSAEGYTTAVLNIESNDEDEPLVQFVLGGNGIVVTVPPAEQIQNILDYFDNAVEEGTIVGYGPGRCSKPEARVKALRHMIVGAGTLIDAGYDEWALCVLISVEKKTDGEKRPPDFVMGDGVPTLNQMVNDLISDLSS